MNDDMELVTSLQVRRWAETKGLLPVGQRGRVSNEIVEAYESANPSHMYSRYAHGPGGYDKGCRCDECREAKFGPKTCVPCSRYRGYVTTAQNEVRRLARAMARSERNAERMAPVLAKAKEGLAKAKETLEAHKRDHRDDAA